MVYSNPQMNHMLHSSHEPSYTPHSPLGTKACTTQPLWHPGMHHTTPLCKDCVLVYCNVLLWLQSLFTPLPATRSRHHDTLEGPYSPWTIDTPAVSAGIALGTGASPWGVSGRLRGAGAGHRQSSMAGRTGKSWGCHQCSARTGNPGAGQTKNDWLESPAQGHWEHPTGCKKTKQLLWPN